MILILLWEIIKIVLIVFGVAVLINLIPTKKKPSEQPKTEDGKYGKWWD